MPANKFERKKIYYTPDSIYALLYDMHDSKSYTLCFDDINSIKICGKDNDDDAEYTVIYPGFIKNLNNIKRNENYLEIGSETIINDILKKGRNIIPRILAKALENTGPPNLRNILTIGGLIFSPEKRNKVYTALSLLNTKIEIRSYNSRKWLFIPQLFNHETPAIKPKEVPVKIRIPVNNYEIEYYKEISDIYQKGTELCFCGIASVSKHSITMCKFAAGNWGQDILREKEIEALLTEQKIPFSEKEKIRMVKEFAELFKKKYINFFPYEQKILINLFTDFIESCNPNL